MPDSPGSNQRTAEEAAHLDVGVGDPEAPANAIPNVIAHLIETETWRNSATVVMAALLVGLGLWAYSGVKSAITEARIGGLEALLETVVKGLDVWVGEYRADVRRWAAEPEVAALAGRLADLGRDPGEPGASCRAPAASELAKVFGGALLTRERGIRSFLVLDRTGLVLAADTPGVCGRRIRSLLFRKRLDEAFEGKPAFARPSPEPELSLAGAATQRRPVAWFLVPVQDAAARVTAVLGFGVVADRELATIFSAARPGVTAEVYAFADDGLMLTESRFVDDLVARGLIAEAGPRTAVFQVQVRDPGPALEAGAARATEAGAWPLTRAAALAIAARGKEGESERRGAVSIAYRDYRGDEAIGAWRWLEAYDLGVVAEISTGETFGPLRTLVLAFVVIGGFVALSLAAALISSLSLSRLQRHFGRLQRLGAYTLERQIDEGGMATVHLARHALLERPTAVKILKKHVASDEFVARFEREVQLASGLRHPNNIQIYDYGRTRDGAPYYVMEFLDGVTLAELVAHSSAVPAARAIHILRQICAALREAHLAGIIHRDVKPENVMVCRRGEDDFVKLLDYGLVKDLSRQDTRDLTRQLRVLGTPRYMSPERILNPGDVDARSDLYAVGALGFLLLTGTHVFEASDDADIATQVLHAPPPRPSERAAVPVPTELDDLIFACLQKDRALRPQSAEAMMESLTRLALQYPWAQRDAAAWWEGFRAQGGVAAGAPAATATPARR